jgi:hypothetical protein
MYRKFLLKKNNGFLLLSTYVALIVLIIFSVALFGRVTHEHKFATISQQSLSARYAAERGIEYVVAEIKYNRDFHTHNAVAEGENYILQPEDDPRVTTADLNMENVIIDENGNYASVFPNEDSQFVVRIYHDPQIPDETIILSRGISKNQTRLIVSKYIPQSLYRFFIFTPYEFWPELGHYDAGGGRIHSNDWIFFSGKTEFSNISELSTAKYFKYYARSMIPIGDTGIDRGDGTTYTWDEVFWNWREPWVRPHNTQIEELKYYNRYDGKNYGDETGLLMLENGRAVAWDGISDYLDPYLPENFNYYMCTDRDPNCTNGLNEWHTIINGITIPNKFDKGYDWNKYYILENCYWYDNICFTYPEEIITAYHLDTQKQYNEWMDFLGEDGDGYALQGIVMDANTGGLYYEPLNIISTEYQEAAQTDGIYIDFQPSGGPGEPEELNVYINSNQPLQWNGDQIDINGVQAVFKKDWFIDPNSTNQKDVIVLDIGKLKQAYQNKDPSGNATLAQNIIYTNYNIVLTDASSILTNGLTIVSEKHIYFHGNYNDISNKPSAAIAAGDIYTLSNDWDFPKELETTFHNPNYPYEHDFYCPQDNEKCIDILINDYGRDPDETTHPDYPMGRNWFQENYQNMPNFVDYTLNHIYNVALVGYTSYSPMVLERWGYYTDPGNSTTPPSMWVNAKREITGALVQLQNNNFPFLDLHDTAKRRCCSEGYNPCRDCSIYPGWSWDMSTNSPAGNYNLYYYDTQFANGNVPPGDLFGFTSTIFLELEDSAFYWNYHYNPLSMPSS